MISLITQIVEKHPEWLRGSGAPLSFLKLSTASLGRYSEEGKVLIFVFEDRQASPTLCIKTVRRYSAGDLIKRNYHNLQVLEKETRGSSFIDMFARPLDFYDDGETIFVIETICPGSMFSAQIQKMSIVIEKYTAWQTYLARLSNEAWTIFDIQELVFDLIESLTLAEESPLVLHDYYNRLNLDFNIRLPRIVQHGDMTPDNVLISDKNVYLIDYDYVDFTRLPGFDLFNFLMKSKSQKNFFPDNYERYFLEYFKMIGAEVEAVEGLLFVYYLLEIKRKNNRGGQKNSQEIIKDFSALINKT
ncbi:MAG TPA: phosphotransferase [Candidatus Paceibacterota bacterium]|nr:phosphotransferase [Candidatus Paceibacterota bacterium]